MISSQNTAFMCIPALSSQVCHVIWNNKTDVVLTEMTPTGTFLELKYLLLFTKLLYDILMCLVKNV